MMIGSGGAVARRPRSGAWVVGPASMGVGLLEFHQLDRMVAAGRAAARAAAGAGGRRPAPAACAGDPAPEAAEVSASASPVASG